MSKPEVQNEAVEKKSSSWVFPNIMEKDATLGNSRLSSCNC